MNRRLKKYLSKQGATSVDDQVLQNYRVEMDRVMPEITKSIKQRELRAAELRVGANRKSRVHNTES